MTREYHQPHAKRNIHKVIVQPSVLYGMETILMTRSHVSKLEVTEMKMCRCSCGHTLREHVRHDDIRDRQSCLSQRPHNQVGTARRRSRYEFDCSVSTCLTPSYNTKHVFTMNIPKLMYSWLLLQQTEYRQDSKQSFIGVVMLSLSKSV